MKKIFKKKEKVIKRKGKGFSVVCYWNTKTNQAWPKDELPQKAEGAERFVCVSDTHTREPGFTVEEKMNIPEEFDYLLHGGDFSFSGKYVNIRKFNEWLGSLGGEKIVIAGNHDITFHKEYYEKNWKRFHQTHRENIEETPASELLTNCVYLQDDSHPIKFQENQLNVYGSPWQPEFCDWAFNLDRGKECKEIWEKIPEETHILITHGPARNHGGQTNFGVPAGCEDLLRKIEKVKPLVHVFGHIHEAYGVYENKNTIFINACNVNLKYNLVNPAIVFDIIPLE